MAKKDMSLTAGPADIQANNSIASITETSSAPVVEKKRPGRKPAEMKTAASAAEKKTQGRKPAAKKTGGISASDKSIKEKAPAAKRQTAKKPAEASSNKTTAKKTSAASKSAAPAKSSSRKAPDVIAEKPAARGSRRKGLTYEEVVDAAGKKVKAADFSKINGSISVNVHIEGACAGDFYIEYKEGKVSVEPFDYKNADIYIRASAEEFFKVMTNKSKFVEAVSGGNLMIEGNAQKAALFVIAAF